jgi:nucleoside-diphosphate-sugar epimerase
MSKQSVLLIGGAGYLGTAISYRLLQLGHMVLCVDNCKPVLSDVMQAQDSSIFDVDSVIYMATSFDSGDNITYFKLIADTCDNYNKNLIYISSCGITNANDKSQYTNSKRQCEALLTTVKRNNNWNIVRLAPIFGWQVPMNWISLPNAMVKQALSSTHTIDVLHPNENRPIIHIDDAVKAISRFVSTSYKTAFHGTYNLATINITKLEMADKIACLLPNTTVNIDGDYDRTGYFISRNNMRLLNIYMFTDFEEGIKEIIQNQLLDKTKLKEDF